MTPLTEHNTPCHPDLHQAHASLHLGKDSTPMLQNELKRLNKLKHNIRNLPKHAWILDLITNSVNLVILSLYILLGKQRQKPS